MTNRLSRRMLLTGAGAGLGAGLGAAGQGNPQGAGGASPGPPLNLIQIVADTWGAGWLGCYGRSFARTPNVDGLAAKSALFLDAYPESLPTLPARRAMYTGRRVFPSELVLQRDDHVRIRGWHQLFAEDVTLAETLAGSGYVTALVSDVYHQFKPDKNFHRGFEAWRWIRGQESDRLETGPRRAVRLANYLHPSQTSQRGLRAGVHQYLLNRREWRTEDDWHAARVFHEAGRWLENNVEDGRPFYLHIESFSPHEYWDPPEEYYRLYMKTAYFGPRLIQPPLYSKELSAVEMEHVRALYAGMVTFVDACLGKFLRRAEALGVLKNTIVVFAGDHGTMMGEQGQIHKAETRLRRQVTQVPLLIYHPRQNWAGVRIGGFVQHTDIMPTLLDLMGQKIPARVTGESLLPLIETGGNSRRDVAVTGWGDHASVRSAGYNYIARWNNGNPFEELYDLQKDPDELENVAAQHPALVSDFRTKLKRHVDTALPQTRGTFARILTS